MVFCLLCSPCHTAVRIKNCLKSTPVIKVATMEIRWCRVPQLSSETEVFITLLCQLCLTHYTAVQIKNCLRSTSVLKVATMKSMDDFSLRKGSHHVQPQLTLVTVSKDEWNTKEDTGKSLKNALHLLRYAKRYLSGWSDVEQWKNQARSLSCYQVTLVWRHQAVS